MGRTRRRPLLFLHVPKSAGTTIRTLLEYTFHEKAILRVDDDTFSTNIPRRIQFVSGHLHAYYRQHFYQDPELITLLRDPIERIISAYSYWRSSNATESFLKYHPEVALAKSMDFRNFVRSSDPRLKGELSNFHVRWLGQKKQGINYSLDDLLQNSKRLLADTIWFGIVERMGDSLKLLQHAFSLPPQPSELRLNATSFQFRDYKIDERTLDILKEENRYDLELYEHATELLSSRLASIASEASWRDKYESSPPPIKARARSITMEKSIIGSGWWARESKNHLTWRAAYIGSVPSIYTWWPTRRPSIVVFCFPHWKPGFSWDTFSVELNDVTYPQVILESNSGRIAVVAAAASSFPLDRLTKIAFVHKLRPKSASIGSEEDRFTHAAQTSFALRDVNWFAQTAGGEFSHALRAYFETRGVRKESQRYAARELIHVSGMALKSFRPRSHSSGRRSLELPRYWPPFRLIMKGLQTNAKELRGEKVEVSTAYLKLLLRILAKRADCNPSWYLEAYRDVKEAYADSAEISAAHFVSSGFLEGRLPDEPAFDYKWYWSYYTDLQMHFAPEDEKGLRDHFFGSGYRAGRAGTAETLALAEEWRTGKRK